jgi:hypothetical protein
VSERLWQHATRDLTESQWRHGVDVVIRTWRSTWMPPPAVVIEAAFTAPPPPPRTAPICEHGEFWDSPAQQAHVERTPRDNPRGANEGPMSYIRRIAITAGLVADDTPRPPGRDPGQEG